MNQLECRVEELIDAQLDELFPRPVWKLPVPSRFELKMLTEILADGTDEDTKALIKKRLFVLRLHFGN